MDCNKLIKRLSEELKFSELKFSDEGVISFLVNDEYSVDFEKSADQIYLTIYGIVGILPPIDREEFLLELATGNYFGWQTEGAVLSVDKDTEEVVLFKTLDIRHLHFDDFFGEFQKFINVQKYWVNFFGSKEYVYVPKRIFPY